MIRSLFTDICSSRYRQTDSQQHFRSHLSTQLPLFCNSYVQFWENKRKKIDYSPTLPEMFSLDIRSRQVLDCSNLRVDENLLYFPTSLIKQCKNVLSLVSLWNHHNELMIIRTFLSDDCKATVQPILNFKSGLSPNHSHQNE